VVALIAGKGKTIWEHWSSFAASTCAPAVERAESAAERHGRQIQTGGNE
jgi:hypothetical protein